MESWKFSHKMGEKLLLIMKGFHQYDYIEYYNNISVLHSEFEETIKQHQFPEDIIQKANKFPAEMMALQLQEEGGRKIG